LSHNEEVFLFLAFRLVSDFTEILGSHEIGSISVRSKALASTPAFRRRFSPRSPQAGWCSPGRRISAWRWRTAHLAKRCRVRYEFVNDGKRMCRPSSPSDADIDVREFWYEPLGTTVTDAELHGLRADRRRQEGRCNARTNARMLNGRECNGGR